jgi:hypothetical protein
MGFQNVLGGMGKGGLIGAGVGALGGMMMMGPFGLIPGALMGGQFGAMAGGMGGLFRPDYNQIQQTYDPNMVGYGNTRFSRLTTQTGSAIPTRRHMVGFPCRTDCLDSSRLL